MFSWGICSWISMRHRSRKCNLHLFVFLPTQISSMLKASLQICMYFICAILMYIWDIVTCHRLAAFNCLPLQTQMHKTCNKRQIHPRDEIRCVCNFCWNYYWALIDNYNCKHCVPNIFCAVVKLQVHYDWLFHALCYT